MTIDGDILGAGIALAASQMTLWRRFEHRMTRLESKLEAMGVIADAVSRDYPPKIPVLHPRRPFPHEG
jgi:hypothetical protein